MRLEWNSVSKGRWGRLEVAKLEYNLKIKKFKMVDPKWHENFQKMKGHYVIIKNDLIKMKLVFERFWSLVESEFILNVESFGFNMMFSK